METCHKNLTKYWVREEKSYKNQPECNRLVKQQLLEAII